MPEHLPSSPKSVNAIQAIPQSGARTHTEVLAHRLGIDSDPVASFQAFKLNPNGSLARNVQDALTAIKRRPGYSIYEVVITKLDNTYTRAIGSAGLRVEGGISDPYMLSTIEDAHVLYEYNLKAYADRVRSIGATFEYVVVAQAQSEKVTEIGTAATWTDTEGAGLWPSRFEIGEENK